MIFVYYLTCLFVFVAVADRNIFFGRKFHVMDLDSAKYSVSFYTGCLNCPDDVLAYIVNATAFFTRIGSTVADRTMAVFKAYLNKTIVDMGVHMTNGRLSPVVHRCDDKQYHAYFIAKDESLETVCPDNYVHVFLNTVKPLS